MNKLLFVLLLILTSCQQKQAKTLKIEPLYSQFRGSLISRHQQTISLDEGVCDLEYQNGESIKKNDSPVQCEAAWLSDDYKQKARFDGILAIDQEIKILSDEKKLVLHLNEEDLNKIDEKLDYLVNTDRGEKLGTARLSAINFTDDQQFKITFSHDIPHDKVAYENMSVFITDPRAYFIVPSEFILKKEHGLFIKTGNQEIHVEGALFEDYYLITKGIKESMIVTEYIE